ncbi:MAG TPA: hypothetical protein VFV01_47685 [Spirillospora sp.]|nr:hypothetical protein [Spirillospora sp.]
MRLLLLLPAGALVLAGCTSTPAPAHRAGQQAATARVQVCQLTHDIDRVDAGTESVQRFRSRLLDAFEPADDLPATGPVSRALVALSHAANGDDPDAIDRAANRFRTACAS